jgi:adenylate cyclase class 2
MPIEFEAKVLDVEPDELSDQILGLGGRRVGERLMRRYVYDIRAGDESRWIRLRDDGTTVTLTVKEIAARRNRRDDGDRGGRQRLRGHQ